MLNTLEQKKDYVRSLRKDQNLTDREIRKIIAKTFKVKKSRTNEIFRELFDEGAKGVNSGAKPEKEQEQERQVGHRRSAGPQAAGGGDTFIGHGKA